MKLKEKEENNKMRRKKKKKRKEKENTFFFLLSPNPKNIVVQNKQQHQYLEAVKGRNKEIKGGPTALKTPNRDISVQKDSERGSRREKGKNK